MSQDLRRERAGTRYETTVDEPEVSFLETLREAEANGGVWVPVPYDERIAELEAENMRLREFVQKLAKSGLPADLNPTRQISPYAMEQDRWWMNYLERIDESVRWNANAAMDGTDV